CCVGICFCGWFGLRAVNGRSGHAGYVHSQHPQRAQPTTVLYTTTTHMPNSAYQQSAVAPGY
uniref:Uncharacterized protein n=1 Tax=Plectus sambesii TaxID=2011161 RepID=A0A914URF3_9BILA